MTWDQAESTVSFLEEMARESHGMFVGDMPPLPPKPVCVGPMEVKVIHGQFQYKVGLERFTRDQFIAMFTTHVRTMWSA